MKLTKILSSVLAFTLSAMTFGLASCIDVGDLSAVDSASDSQATHTHVLGNGRAPLPRAIAKTLLFCAFARTAVKTKAVRARQTTTFGKLKTNIPRRITSSLASFAIKSSRKRNTWTKATESVSFAICLSRRNT